MIAILSGLCVLAAIGVLGWIVWLDFAVLKITNASVLLLLGLYVIWSALSGFSSLATDLIAGAALFVMSFLMWLGRMMGAGDVKLYAAIGGFVGLNHLMAYAILLLIGSLLFVAVIKVLGRRPSTNKFFSSLNKINQSGNAPYAVPMVFAAVPVILLRNFG